MKRLLYFALVAVAFACPAQAHTIEYGSGVICDTQKQAERLAALFEDDTQSAISAVNDEERNPNACVLANVAFVRGAKLAVKRKNIETLQVFEVLVVGVATGAGFRSARPAVHFTVFRINERGA